MRFVHYNRWVEGAELVLLRIYVIADIAVKLTLWLLREVVDTGKGLGFW